MIKRLFRPLPRFLGNEKGGSAAETAIWLTAIIVPLLSAADVAFYTYRAMQVGLAAQAGVAAVWQSCDSSTKWPAVQRCTGLTSAITTAVQSTTLGTKVTVASGNPVEGYFCVNASGALVQVGTTATTGGTPTPPSPFTCATVIAGSTTKPGDYLRIQTNYTFTATFSAVPVTAFLPATISKTSWIRLN